jgi:hypothetical protein
MVADGIELKRLILFNSLITKLRNYIITIFKELLNYLITIFSKLRNYQVT